jgi:hypothetical protein
MPARNLPTPQDAATARRILLDGLARDSEVVELAGELAPLHPRNSTFPGEVFLHVAVYVLDWCGASRADPLALEGMRERFLPECAFRGGQNKKLQFAILAAAALRGGAEPDLLDEVAWWQADDFWQYALYAAVAYIRAAAGRAGVPVRQAGTARTCRSSPSPTARGRLCDLIFHRSGLTGGLAAADRGEGSRRCSAAPAARWGTRRGVRAFGGRP